MERGRQGEGGKEREMRRGEDKRKRAENLLSISFAASDLADNFFSYVEVSWYLDVLKQDTNRNN